MNKKALCPQIPKWVYLIVFLSVIGGKANAQFYAVKVDALGLLTTTLNVEGAIVVSEHWSLHLPLKVNPWKFGDKQYKHATIMPGARYWFVDSYFRGWFLGVNAVATAYDTRGIISRQTDYFSRDNRYKGFGYGIGISGGISIPVSKRWNIEFEAGVNGLFSDHDIFCEYHQEHKGQKLGYQRGFLPVPGKIAANIVYLF